MEAVEAVVALTGLALAAFLAWFFFGPKKSRKAAVVDGVQEVKITVKGGYSPDLIRVRQGVPLRLVFDRQEAGECTSRVVFPDLAVSKTLPAFGTTTLQFTPEQTGEFSFACGMNMVHGTLLVEPSGSESGADEDGRHRQVARAVGVGPSTESSVTTQQAEFRVSGMSCASCVVNIESMLAELSGVDRVDVSLGTQRATVEYDPTRITPAELQAALADTGYKLTPREAPGSAATEDGEAAERAAEIKDLSRRVLFGAILSAPVVVAVMAVDLFSAGWVPEILMSRWVQLALITPVMFYTGWPIHRTGWLTMRHRTADMNSLITIGTTAAFGYSVFVTLAPTLVPASVRAVYFEAVGVIITLILLGRLLEVRAKAGTGEAIRKLIGLQARTATIIRGGDEVQIPIEDVVPGDLS